MPKTYWISDWHDKHKNICGPSLSSWDKGYRNFSSLEEMHEAIIEGTNSTVGPDDRLIYLGDCVFGMDKLETFRKLWAEIRCRNIVYIRGNHDDWMAKRDNLAEVEKIVGKVYDVYEENICGYDFWNAHYRPEEYYSRANPHNVSHTRENRHVDFSKSTFVRKPNTIYLYGHYHASVPDNPTVLELEIGFDTEWYGHKKWTPYSEDEVLSIMKNHKTPPLT